MFAYALVFRYIASISQNPNFTKFAQDFNKIAQQKCASHALYFVNDDTSLDSLIATEEQTEASETDPTELEPTTKVPTKASIKATTKSPMKSTKPTKPPTETPPSKNKKNYP